jgi:hypothetical protein
MIIITVSDKNRGAELTRIVIGCPDRAADLIRRLNGCGYRAGYAQTAKAPNRSSDEKLRAERIVKEIHDATR